MTYKDRASLIKLASTMSAGSKERKTILAGLVERKTINKTKVVFTLRSVGLGPVTFNNLGKLKPVSDRVTGFRGGSFSSDSVSSSRAENKKTEDHVVAALREIGAVIDRTGHQDGFTATFNQGKDSFSYSFEWTPYATRAGDRDSKTYWLVLSVL